MTFPFDPISVLFHDVDGCLNPEDGEQFRSGEQHRRLSAEQKRMLKRISAAIDDSEVEQVVLTTGRRLVDTLFIAEELASSFNPELEPEQVTMVAPGRRLVIVADGSYTSTGGTFTVLIAEAQGR